MTAMLPQRDESLLICGQVFIVESRMSSSQIAVILKSFDSPDELRVFLKDEMDKWGVIIKEAGIKVE